VTFPQLPSTPLEVRMSRSSPGRYALHEFAKNVYDVHAFNGKGQELALARPNPYEWDVAGHDGTVRVTVDGQDRGRMGPAGRPATQSYVVRR